MKRRDMLLSAAGLPISMTASGWAAARDASTLIESPDGSILIQPALVDDTGRIWSRVVTKDGPRLISNGMLPRPWS